MKTKEQFSDSKKRLLEKFLRGEAVYHSAQAPLEPRQPEDPVPLAPSQQQVWLHAQMAAGSPLYNEPLTLHYRGTLDRTALEAGFENCCAGTRFGELPSRLWMDRPCRRCIPI